MLKLTVMDEDISAHDEVGSDNVALSLLYNNGMGV
jgi:hypothetical protein